MTQCLVVDREQGEQRIEFRLHGGIPFHGPLHPFHSLLELRRVSKSDPEFVNKHLFYEHARTSGPHIGIGGRNGIQPLRDQRAQFRGTGLGPCRRGLGALGSRARVRLAGGRASTRLAADDCQCPCEFG
jgi:hypothetical protein